MKRILLALIAVFFGFNSTILAQNIHQSSSEDTLNHSSKIISNSIDTLTTQTTALAQSPIEAAKVTIDSIIPVSGFSIDSLFRGVLGMFVLLLISFILSKNRKAINWKTVSFGLLAQLLLAIGVLKVPFIQSGFEFVGKIFVKILEFTQAGSVFLLGDMMNVESYGFIFLFQVLPTIIFFSALTSVLFYLGVIQIVVKGLAWVLTKLLGISGAESLSVAGNIFLGQTEAPLMIKAYLERMTKSEILLVMVGGMATVAGGVLAAYIGFLGGDDPVMKIFYAKHLLTASVMAAPGAIVISKMLYPQEETIDSSLEVSQENIGSNFLDAIANGTTEGLKLAANVGAMLLVFVAFIAMINYGFGKIGTIGGLNLWISNNTPYSAFSLEFVLGYLFSPLMWLIGVAKEDMALMGQLLGIKLAASEFVGYIQLADLKNMANSIHFKFEKSIIMATYMLCGFANFASIGIQIGGIGSLAPGQRKTLSAFGIKALIGGTIASLLSATIAGMIIG
ncbi:MAG: Na+ dependent nucleoside transporter [Flavobacteriales bacterium]|nr:Na+ dependent nucleoside transporter [Flavobacteriia bacterium]NCP06219.1 Na+ dependent nucleoside transporter [Flavobacteriales bacterium]PIV92724.1 MAG: Na+ dependent nucleoside transporter [Flavobacteriaceae bacterium CG17_big_fil_post_rev_8_21_14_2_50_33_15]PIY13093.1 MAG: Na+ dependent nucleoside transporter [Flavobacteriaceae bacterium CG_4_10_14_3_um_filter_33_47]PJB19778.1 MAG: Na+ dependent nucleoside transporter [Flavobacteriaceae bacterium CG_4_9_14_3_um_filter_33_16]